LSRRRAPWPTGAIKRLRSSYARGIADFGLQIGDGHVGVFVAAAAIFAGVIWK